MAAVGAAACYFRRRFLRRSFLVSTRREAVVELFILGITPEAIALENCVPILRRCMSDCPVIAFIMFRIGSNCFTS